MQPFFRPLLTAALLVTTFSHSILAAAATRSLYAIGNSLTASMLPFSVPGFASQQGDTFEVGFHTQSGAALDFIVANPAVANIVSPVTLDRAFMGYTWTDLSVEPYPAATSTLASDIAAIQSVMTSAMANGAAAPRLFIYSAWPSQSSFGSAGGFAAYWRSPSADSLSQPSVLQRDYADHLLARLAAAPGISSRPFVIPVGDVMAVLDDLIRAGRVAGITDIAQLYTDNDHVGDVGKFIAGITVYATIFRKNPSGLSVPFGYQQGSGAAVLTPELAAQLEALVWQVVNSDARTGVNTAPVAGAQSLGTPASTPVSLTLAATDVEGSSLTFSLVSAPLHGQLSGQAPALTYTPDPGFAGTDSFSFKASDGGLDSPPAAINIQVLAPPAPPPSADAGGGSLALWGLAGLAGLTLRARMHRKIDATRRD